MLRHGQTDFNLRGIVQGSGVDSSINDTGEKQALDFYRAYRESGFDMLYTSSLKRTHQTVQRFIGNGMPWQTLKDLNEISWGKQEGQPITPEEDQYYQWMLQQWRLGKTDQRIEGGESPDEVAIRLSRALEVLTSSPCNNILVCMHGRAMRILLCLMMGRPLKDMDFFDHQNTCVYQLQYNGGSFEIIKHNDVSHIATLPIESLV